jgi:hypothetical protein
MVIGFARAVGISIKTQLSGNALNANLIWNMRNSK